MKDYYKSCSNCICNKCQNEYCRITCDTCLETQKPVVLNVKDGCDHYMNLSESLSELKMEFCRIFKIDKVIYRILKLIEKVSKKGGIE